MRTPLPPFDVAAFAADSECRLRASAEAERRSTAPPPPYASVHPARSPQLPASPGTPAAPAGPSAAVEAILDCARRAELTRALLRIGGMSREEAARVLRAELERVEAEERVAPVRALMTALAATVAELGGVADEKTQGERAILVLEDDVQLRDRITVALEALGHTVRTAPRSDVLTEISAHEVAAVIVGVDGGGGAAWQLLRELLPLEGVPTIVGARMAGPGLESLAAEAQADDFVRFDLAVDELVEELGTIFAALGVTRGPAQALDD